MKIVITSHFLDHVQFEIKSCDGRRLDAYDDDDELDEIWFDTEPLIRWAMRLRNLPSYISVSTIAFFPKEDLYAYPMSIASSWALAT